MQMYQTSDRFEIYTLLATHCELTGCKRDPDGRVHFMFKDRAKCQSILTALLSRQLTVNMHEVVNAIRDTQAIFIKK